jgi:hypothetical protein
MVESKLQLVALKNQRRVCKALTNFTDLLGRTFLLANDMMYAHTNMDGKIKLIDIQALLAVTLIKHN